jgi:hypothetical protein
MVMNHCCQPGCGGIEVIDPHNHKSEQADAEWGDLRVPQPSGDHPGQRK